MSKVILFLLLLPSILFASEPPPIEPEVTETQLTDATPQLTPGARISLDNLGVSILPPAGWTVKRELGGVSLHMEPPQVVGELYQRSIQVFAFNGPIYVDEITADEYAKTIVKKFQEASSAISDYRIRNYMPIELSNGRPAILYYTEFTLEQVPLMQLHILASSASEHFLLTFTDLTEHFETDDSEHLATAYESMTSIEFESDGPSRIFAPVALFIALLCLCGIWFGLRFWSSKKAAQKLKAQVEDDAELPDDDDDDLQTKWKLDQDTDLSTETSFDDDLDQAG